MTRPRCPGVAPGSLVVRAAVVLLLVIASLVPLAGRRAEAALPAPPAPVAPAPTPATVEITQLGPSTLTPAATLVIRGAVVNRGTEPISGLTVSLHLGPAVSGRDELHALRARPIAQPLAARQQTLGDTPLAPGQRRTFTLSVAARDLGLSATGVYPLQVTAVGGVAGSYRDVGTANTAIPYLPAPPGHRMHLAFVVPLTAAPALAGDDTLTDSAAEATLHHAVAPGGRLGTLLDAAGTRGATPVVDPALVEALQALAGPHRLQGNTAVHPGDAAAKAWLSRLRARVGRSGLARLPYGDPDLEALAHGGLPESLQEADRRGADVLQQALGTVGDPRIGAPPGGVVDDAGLDVMATRLGTSSVVLRGDSVSTVAGTGVVALSGRAAPERALLTDPSLTALLGSGPGTASILASQDVVAEAAAAALGTPDAPSAALVVPLPVTVPGGSWQRQVTAELAASPLLAPTGLVSLAAATPGDSIVVGSGPAGGAGDGSAGPAGPELGAGVLANVRNLRADVADLQTALPNFPADDRPCPTLPEPPARQPAEQLTDPACRALLLAVAAAWRQPADAPGGLPGGGPAGSDAQQKIARVSLGAIRASVRAVASHEVALTSRTGRVPVTLENNLGEPVRVTLVLGTADRASVRSGAAVARTVQPGQKVQVEVEVRAAAAGTFPVTLSLLSPGGRLFGTPSQVLVRSTAYGVLAVALTVGALAVLVVAVLYRAARGLWRGRQRRMDRASDTARTGTA